MIIITCNIFSLSFASVSTATVGAVRCLEGEVDGVEMGVLLASLCQDLDLDDSVCLLCSILNTVWSNE